VPRAEAAKGRAEQRLAEHSENLDVMRAELALRKALVRIDAAERK
jgi:F-type H+-transporting ATPase subunit epsilon